MDLKKNLILLNNEIKTSQIRTIYRKDKGYYTISFTSSGKFYTYARGKVVWLTNPSKIDSSKSIIYVNNKRKYDIQELYLFNSLGKNYYTIVSKDGNISQYSEEDIRIRRSCLEDAAISHIFKYLHECALTNPLGEIPDKPESKKILGEIFSKLDFIDTASAAAPYLYCGKGLSKYPEKMSIFPFGCNSSQQKAVRNALENKISVIQGPPGTGKTQTILNIIANLLLDGKSVLVVSNNNAATANVKEKLAKFGLDFLIASLGSKDNKERFIASQPPLNPELQSWSLAESTLNECLKEAQESTLSVNRLFTMQENLANLRQELSGLETERIHFENTHPTTTALPDKKSLPSSRYVIQCWHKLHSLSEIDKKHKNAVTRLKTFVKSLIVRQRYKAIFNAAPKLEPLSIGAELDNLEAAIYAIRIAELKSEISEIENELSLTNATDLLKDMASKSMKALRAVIASRFGTYRATFNNSSEIYNNGISFLQAFPVVLSTTFSARSCFNKETMFDYVIMDEASQVSVETGFLAMTCAENAVIVGDLKQLPNVIKPESQKILDSITAASDVSSCFDCGHNSFLSSVLEAVKNVPETMLREHYRCHPDIINFCNQKFYGGKLIIMTERKEEQKATLLAYTTSEGNHARGHYNQREIDVIKQEVLPFLESDDIGIITPYKEQVQNLKEQLPGIETATVHKFQGREKRSIILSVTDDQISEFADNANLVNVAVSRAQESFCLVVSGNPQQLDGNIKDLLRYIKYQHGCVTKSKLRSIFDCLYTTIYSSNRTELLKFESEKLTYDLIERIADAHSSLSNIDAVVHYPLRSLISDPSLLTEDERQYAANPSTHIDFLIINRVSKEPLLAIETDGYTFHKKDSYQYQRDLLKNEILKKYGLPLLRLSTVGHSEEEQILKAFKDIGILENV